MGAVVRNQAPHGPGRRTLDGAVVMGAVA
jgi:hypothetical protein